VKNAPGDTGGSGTAPRFVTAAAFAALVLAPLLAGALTKGTPAALLSLPAESIAVVLILLAIPGRRLRWIVAAAFGVLVVGATVLAALDLGFEATVDRAFSLTDDGPALISAFGVVEDATGTANAVLIVIVLVGLLIGAVILLARAALRAERVTVRSGRTGRVAAAAVTTTWIVCAVIGVQLLPGVPFASSDSASALVATSEQTAQSLRDQVSFRRAVQTDRFSGVPADQLLSVLKGKDVVIAFIESYGKVAVQDSSFSPAVDRVLQAGDAQLTHDGYSAQSAFLTSPTFGGVSWLAHSTVQSGVWVDSRQNYERLTSGDRFTLTRAFHDGGWRTVSVIPSNKEPWDVGKAFYDYDEMLKSLDMGYRGPTYSYARIPDQYTWQHFYDTELSHPHAPVMAEIDFVSSHTPWTPLPHLIPWSDIGDGSVYDPQPAQGLTPVEVWPDAKKVQKLYGESVQYSLGAMFSFLHTYDQPNMVLIVLGDHQPARIVSGARADHDVPISIISKDPSVFEKIASWHWDAGVLPSPSAPVWRMDQFRDRFFEAFTPCRDRDGAFRSLEHGYPPLFRKSGPS
jgi:hypothetical protein